MGTVSQEYLLQIKKHYLKSSLITIFWWFATPLSGFGVFGLYLRDAAKYADISQFMLLMMGLSYSSILVFISNLVFLIESHAIVTKLVAHQDQTTQIFSVLFTLMLSVAIIQILLNIYALQKQGKNPSCEHSHFRSHTDMRIYVCGCIVNNLPLEILFTLMATYLQVNIGCTVPFVGLVITHIFCLATAPYYLKSLIMGKKMTERRQAHMTFVMRGLSALIGKLYAFLFFLDSILKLSKSPESAQNGFKACWLILIFLICQCLFTSLFYLSPLIKGRDKKQNLLCADLCLHQATQILILISCTIVYTLLPNASTPLLAAAFISWAVSSKLLFYVFGEVIELSESEAFSMIYHRKSCKKGTQNLEDTAEISQIYASRSNSSQIHDEPVLEN